MSNNYAVDSKSAPATPPRDAFASGDAKELPNVKSPFNSTNANAATTPTPIASAVPPTTPLPAAITTLSGASPPIATTATTTTTAAPLTPAQLVETKFAAEFAELTDMGIARADVIDALIICGQNKEVIARCTEYLFATSQRKEAIRLAEMNKKLQKAEEAHKAQMDRITAEFAVKKRALQLEAYTAFLTTLLADGHLNSVELKKIEVQRNHSDVSDAEHRAILVRLGFAGGESGSKWSEVVAEGQTRTEKLEVSSDCSHCHNVKHQLPTDHIVMDCMHLCLCEECAKLYQKPNSQCPKCRRPARKVVKTFR